MARGMSPLRLFVGNEPRQTLPDSIDGNASGLDGPGAAAAQARQPLGLIPECVRNPLTPAVEESNGDSSTPQGKSEHLTPRAKGKSSCHDPEKFPHLENSEGNVNHINATPENNTMTSLASSVAAPSNSKNKFTGQHRQGWTAQNNPRDYPPDLSTPPRPCKQPASAVGQATMSCRTQPMVSSNSRGAVQGTTKTVRTVEAMPNTESETGGSQSQNATPCKSMSKSLKCGQRTSSNNSGTSGLSSARSMLSQPLVPLPLGYVQAVKGVPPQTLNQNSAEQYFELEEDSSFWRDHNVQVLIRIRPISKSELAAQGLNRCLKQDSPYTLSWLGQPESRLTFDHVAGETISQAKLFEVAGLPMVENCLSGYNSCMFAYGQTGSGKTHTMLGDIEDLDRSPSEQRGITPRVFEYLFSRIRMEQESRRQEHLKFFCKCSFLEIYNEQITDLLEPSSTNLHMREDSKKGVYVENLSEVEVQGVQDVIRLLLQGAANKKVAATNMNQESSRSHSVFTCVVESKWETNSMVNSRYGRLHLVDLAGSERQKSSGAEGGRLKEAANINKSLSTLGLVIMILVDVANGKQRHVPYRDSKLTFLLQDSLGGNSKTIMIANVSPSSCCAMETLSTLKFAQRAKFIRNNAVINEAASGDVIALRQQIEELKVEVDRLRCESLSRTPLRFSARENGSVVGGKSGYKLDPSAVDCTEIGCSSPDSVNINKAETYSAENNNKNSRSEAALVGAQQREQTVTSKPAVDKRTAIFESCRKSPQTSEKVGPRMADLDEDMSQLDSSRGSLEHGRSLSGSTAAGLEERESQYLEMQRRLASAEMKITELQTVIDLGAAQVLVDKNNWEADKRKLEEEKCARETELRDVIDAAELKLLATEAELRKVAVILSDRDAKMHNVENEWRRENEALARKLTEAKLDASEKRSESAVLLQKFQDGQATLKEAEDLVDALVRANENAKRHALDWKSGSWHTKVAALQEDLNGRTKEIQPLDNKKIIDCDGAKAELPQNEQLQQFLQLFQQEFSCTHEVLMNTLACCAATVSEMPDISVQCEELGLLGSVGKLDHKFHSDFLEMKKDILNFQQAAQEMLHFWRLRVIVTEQEKQKLMAELQELQLSNCDLEDKLDENRHTISVLELMLEEQRMTHSLQIITNQLKAVERDRDKFQTEVVVLNEQLEMAQALADDYDIAAAEAQQVAEEKEEEARILGRSVEELEKTVLVLESQLGIMNREAERHRVAKEVLEKELEALKHQMALMEAAIDSTQAQTLEGSQDAGTAKTDLDRIVIEMKNQQLQARKSVDSLQQECAEKDVQLRSFKAHIHELIVGAEKQASENQQKLKSLESMVEKLKVEERKVNLTGRRIGKAVEKLTTSKVKRSGSPFKCIGSGLAQPEASEMDGELSAAKRRIKEVEAVAVSRQKEVFMLNTKLAEAESMTHDVVRDLLGVKTDIASYATFLSQQQVQHLSKRARLRPVEAQQLARRDQPQAGQGCGCSGLR